jgi:hypothetical protein
MARMCRSLLAVLLLGACANARPRLDERAAQLPPPDRARIGEAQRRVDTAQAQVEAADMARVQAQLLYGEANDHLWGAKKLREASHDPAEIGLEREEAAAASARDYAARLVELRDAELEQHELELEAARAYVQWVKAREVDRRAPGAADETPYVEARRRIDDRLADARRRAAALKGDTEQLRVTWEARRAEVAQFHPTLLSPTRAPAPAPREAPTDVNEGPSAPQSMPNPNFTR